MNKPEIIEIQAAELLPKVRQLNEEGYRFVQIAANRLRQPADPATAAYEFHYSFDKDYGLKILHLTIGKDQELSSITGTYLAAYLAENEIKEHFGIKVLNLAVDFKGALYKTAVKHPFAQEKLTKDSDKG